MPMPTNKQTLSACCMLVIFENVADSIDTNYTLCDPGPVTNNTSIH